MDMTAVAQVVSTLGFPIAACVGLFWYVNKREAQTKETIDKLSDTINNNTIAITKLVEKLEKEKV